MLMVPGERKIYTPDNDGTVKKIGLTEVMNGSNESSM